MGTNQSADKSTDSSAPRQQRRATKQAAASPHTGTARRSRPGDPATLTSEESFMLDRLKPFVKREVSAEVLAVLSGTNTAELYEFLGLEPGKRHSAQDVHNALVAKVRSLDAKVKEHDARLGDVETAQSATAHEVKKHGYRIADVERKTEGITLANARIAVLERMLKDSGLDREDIRASLQAGSKGGRKSFIRTLRARKMTDEQIRQIVTVVEDGNEVDMTDEELFAELFDEVRSLDADVTALKTKVDGDGTDANPGIDKLRMRVTNVEHSHRELREVVTESNRTPGWVWIVAGVVGLIAGIWWWLHDFSVSFKNGSSTITLYNWGDSWLAPFVVGFAFFIGVLGILVLLFGGRTRSHEEHTSSTTQVADRTIDEQPAPAPQPRDQLDDTKQYAPVGSDQGQKTNA